MGPDDLWQLIYPFATWEVCNVLLDAREDDVTCSFDSLVGLGVVDRCEASLRAQLVAKALKS